ncbi:MAG: efflux RND transporter permease subunit [Candidatus Izemoplasmataceae bacterium]
MNKLLDQLLTRRKTIILLFIFILGYGIFSYVKIPKQDMPALSTPYMAISLTVPTLSAEELENQLAEDVEDIILTYTDVVDVDTTLYDYYALFLVTYSFDTENPAELSEEIYEKINALEFPFDVSNMTISYDFETPHAVYALHGASHDELLQKASTLKNNLLLIDEIKRAEIHTPKQEELHIMIDSNLLTQYKITMIDLYQLIQSNLIDIPVGYITIDGYQIALTTEQIIETIDELKQMIVIPATMTSEAVLLDDLATFDLVDTSRKIYHFENEEAIFISIFFNDNIDFTRLSDTLQASISDFEKEELSSISLEEIVFLPDYVDGQINSVFYSLLIAIGVVMIVVFFGIGLRNSFLIILTIPIVIFGVIALLYILDYELQKISIVGLIVAIGILVDNSIVITESVKRHIDDHMPSQEAALLSIKENFLPVLTSTLTTITAFVAIIMLPGFLGEIISTMPLTVIFALSLSFIISMTLSPILACMFLKPSKPKKAKKTNEKNIKQMIRFTVKYPVLWIIISVVFLVGTGYIAFLTQEVDLYPNDERSAYYIDIEADITSDLTQTQQIVEEVTDFIKDNDQTVNYISSVGGNLMDLHFSTKQIKERPNIARIYVNTTFEEVELMQFVEDLQHDLISIDRAKIRVHTLELSPPVPPLKLTLTSSNQAMLSEKTNLLLSEIDQIEYVSYASTSSEEGMKINVTYHQDMLNTYGITKAEVDSFLQSQLYGLPFAFYQDQAKLMGQAATIPEVLALEFYHKTSDQSILLDDLIDLSVEMQETSILRHNQIRYTTIDLYPIEDASLATVTDDIDAIVNDINMENVKIQYTGENTMFEDISGDLIQASIVAMIVIYLIMLFEFNHFIKPLMVLATIPLSFTGSFLFMIIFHIPFSATGLIGMVSLIGVTVNNGILLIEYISRHTEDYSVEEACVEAVYLRFRPIILTSLTTIFGLIPLYITGGNFFQPLAITFMGGMMTATIITLFLVPSMYYLIFNKKQTKKDA